MPRYIDAEKAVLIIDRYRKSLEKPKYKNIADAIKDIITVICPTADVQEVKHGYWKEVWHKEDEFVNHHFRVCSCCGAEFHASLMAGCCADIEGDGYVFPNCPACWAVMDGKESGE